MSITISRETAEAFRWLSGKPLEEQLFIVTQLFKDPASLEKKLGEEEFGYLQSIVTEVRNLIVVRGILKTSLVKHLEENFKLDDSVASFLIDKIDKLTPTPIEDARVLGKLSPDELRTASKAVVSLYLTGEAGPSLEDEKMNVAHRFILNHVVERVLRGDANFTGIKNDLLDIFGSEEKVEAFVQVIEGNIEELRKKLMYMRLADTVTVVSELRDSTKELWLTVRDLAEVLKKLSSRRPKAGYVT